MATKNRVEKFNTIVGNSPVGLEGSEEFWKQVKFQASIILEEAQELYEAALDKDLTNLVKEACDVDYTYTYMEILLEKAGVNMGCAIDSVTLNNDQKYTLSEELASLSAHVLEAVGMQTYVDEVEYEGDTYYMVKRWSDGKVLKLLEHVDPNVAATIPPMTQTVLGGRG